MSTGLKEALEYVVALRKPVVETIHGEMYTDKNMQRIKRELVIDELRMETLTGLVDYIKSNTDEQELSNKMIVHVISPVQVKLLSGLNHDRERNCLVQVDADLPCFRYGEYMGSEEFLINIRSKFIQNEDALNVLKFAGTAEASSISTYSDDGVSQSAAVKKGIVGMETALVPNPVILCPYRTFAEVVQPESEFIFRMKNRNNEAMCALFEADGGVWKRAAMKNIKDYLETQLSDHKNITVIS